MTLRDLHNIPKFTELFADQRFIAILHYMRENIDRPKLEGSTSELLIHRGGHKEGWLDSINKIPALAIAPPLPVSSRPQNLYSERP